MTIALAMCAGLLPLVLAAGLGVPGKVGRATLALAPWAAGPTLVLALLPAADFPPVHLEWLILGTRLGLDPVGRVFLLLFAILWTVAGVFARGYVETSERPRFFLFYLLTMAGNLALPLAGDAPSFYLAFALMTFSGYGLVVHRADGEALRAGKVYLALAVIGEAFLLCGLVLWANASGSIALSEMPAPLGEMTGWVTGCLLVGFGVKAGAVPLHVWLPLAHPVAPTPASAVLSGAMIKAGLLGWIRFLPLGDPNMGGWGTIVLLLGLLAAFFGVAIGVLQTEPKTVLAYSSISQMGLMNVGLGIGLASPEAAGAVGVGLSVFALHHGLAKGALFLGVGVSRAGKWQRVAVAVGLGFPALAIAGAPYSSGSLGKGTLKGLVEMGPSGWIPWLEWILPLSSAATALLLGRFLHLMWTSDAHGARTGPWIWAPWFANVAAVVGGFALLGSLDLLPTTPYYGSGLAIQLAPVLVGGLLAWLIWWRKGIAPKVDEPLIEPGDVLIPFEKLIEARPTFPRFEFRRDPVLVLSSLWYSVYAESRREDLALRLELRFTRWAPAIFAVVAVMAILYLSLTVAR